jgi:hypothetical protein
MSTIEYPANIRDLIILYRLRRRELDNIQQAAHDRGEKLDDMIASEKYIKAVENLNVTGRWLAVAVDAWLNP